MQSSNENQTTPNENGPSNLQPPIFKQNLLYCKICTYPPEYCEYGTSISKCKKWLLEAEAELYSKLYPEIDQVNLENLSVKDIEKIKKLEQEALKKEAKEDAKAERIKEKNKSNKVTVKTVERTKRKRITTVHGLDQFGVDLKKLAKLFASRFATGASVTKNAQGDDEIVIQGDVSDDVLDLFESTTGKFAEMIGNGKIPDDNIVFVDDTKKKKPPQ